MGKALATAGFAALCLLLPQAGFAQQKNLDKAAAILEQQSRTGKGEFITFLTGAATAYRWMGASFDLGSTERAYCPAPGVQLDGRSYAKIALEEYKRAKSEYTILTEYPLNVLTLALMRGLRGKYPCKSAEAATPPASPPASASTEAPRE